MSSRDRTYANRVTSSPVRALSRANTNTVHTPAARLGQRRTAGPGGKPHASTAPAAAMTHHAKAAATAAETSTGRRSRTSVLTPTDEWAAALEAQLARMRAAFTRAGVLSSATAMSGTAATSASSHSTAARTSGSGGASRPRLPRASSERPQKSLTSTVPVHAARHRVTSPRPTPLPPPHELLPARVAEDEEGEDEGEASLGHPSSGSALEEFERASSEASSPSDFSHNEEEEGDAVVAAAEGVQAVRPEASAAMLHIEEVGDALLAASAQVDADEGVFAAQAALESRVMELLRAWRAAASSPAESRTASRRPSGRHNGPSPQATSSSPSGALGVTHSSRPGITAADLLAGGAGPDGGAGTQRVLRDLNEARTRIAGLAKLHAELTGSEVQYRDLQRRYVVEQDLLVELDDICAFLQSGDGDASRGEQQPQRMPRSSGRPRDGDLGRRNVAACLRLAEHLRHRHAQIAERLTDELLWMRAEVERHDWSAVEAATPLTRMEAVAPLRAGDARAPAPSDADETRRSAGSRTRRRAHGTLPYSEGAPARAADGGADPVDSARGTIRASLSTVGTDADASVRASETRDSFLLRVQVPVFAAAAPPPLSQVLAPAVPQDTAQAPQRLSGGGSGGAGLVRRRSGTRNSGGGATALASVSVVATPQRYAFVQLYECCRGFLAAMLDRLTALHARLREDLLRLQRDAQDLDAYDPTADALMERSEALAAHVAQLDVWVTEVLRLDQVLHEQVKVPLDGALQTYERLRTQLLEVLKQRLEEEESEHARRRSAEAVMSGLDDTEDDPLGEESSRAPPQRPSDTEAACASDSTGGRGSRTRADAEGADAGNGEAAEGEEPRGGGGDGNGSVGAPSAPPLTPPPTSRAAEQSVAGSPSPASAGATTAAAAAAAASSAARLPRASAEFVGMLEALLQDQRVAAMGAAAAAAVTAGVESVLRHGSYAVTDSGAAQAAAGADTALNTSHGPLSESAPPLAAEVAAQPSDETTWGGTAPCESGTEPPPTPSRVAGRRRTRHEADEDLAAAQDAAVSQSAEPSAAPQHPSATSAAPDITVYVSSASDSEADASEVHRHSEVYAQEAEQGRGVAGGAVGHNCRAHNDVDEEGSAGDERNDSGSEEASDGSSSSDDAPRDTRGSWSRHSGAWSHVPWGWHAAQPPQRYGLGSGMGFRAGLAALCAAVVDRALRFGDSDDEAEETESDAHHRRGAHASSASGPSSKRARRE